MEAISDPTAAAVYWPYLAIAVIGSALLYSAVRLSLLIVNRRYVRNRDMVWLEVTPPASIEKTPEATEQLFSVIHGMRTARRVKDKIFGRQPIMSFEITSTRKEGIRYQVQVEKVSLQRMQKMITSYLPESKIREIEIVSSAVDDVIEFTQTSHYVLPLTLTSLMEQHDPLSYVTGAMTKLSDNESVTLQMIVQPVKLREAVRLSHKILGNENILQHVRASKSSGLSKLSSVIDTATTGLTDLTSEVYIGTTYGYKNYYDSKSKQRQTQTVTTNRDRPSRTLSMFESELMETMHRKVTQPLFQVNLRLLIQSGTSKEHMAALKSALDGFSVPPYQSLKTKLRLPFFNKLRVMQANDRLPNLLRRNATILSSSELASLYHFPASRISKTDNLVSSYSRTLPAPISLKSGRQLGILLGENHHHGLTTPIGLTEGERERHVYIIGGTGNGKTTMLFYGIVQDIRAGKGIAVLDPHGDLAERILRHIPKERIQDVIYLNPDDLSHPIGINLLELSDVGGDELLREKDLVTEATISVLRKIFSDDDSGGHRIEYVLRNAIQTALTLENPTLFTIFNLLNDAKFRRSVLKELQDKNLKDFWENEIGKAGEFQRVKMAAGITAKIGRFLFSASARRVLEQHKSTINFEDILATNKILICNFSKGLIGEDTSTLFGTTILAKLQTAALRRARLHQENRTPFYLYVDEFQNFATTSFVQMLSEARKYKLFLTMAEQSTSQQEEQRLVDIILANVGTVICFRSGSPSDERLVLPLFYPLINQGEIANLPAYSYYARIAAIDAQEPMSGMTVVITETGSEEIATKVIESSRKLYGTIAAAPHAAITVSKPTKEKRKNHTNDLTITKSVT